MSRTGFLHLPDAQTQPVLVPTRQYPPFLICQRGTVQWLLEPYPPDNPSRPYNQPIAQAAAPGRWVWQPLGD